MKVSVGIDLGTTNSVVGYMSNGKINYVKFRNKESLPSVVLYQDGKYIVGEKARKKSMLYPNNYIKSSKTYLGDFDKTWNIDDKGITPTRVAKEILGEIRSAIQKEMAIDDGLEAVITVPAYFTSSQIDETKKAAEIAGFGVKQIITEPVSAALAYGFEDALDQKIFIVDIGGGTFDTAILEVNNRDFSTLAIGGDNKLGGDDFDKVILELFLKYIRIDEGVNLASLEKSDLEESVYHKAYHMLTMKAEEIKVELSEHEKVEISIANLFDNYNFEMSLSRSDFESASSSILEKIQSEIEKTIEESGLDVSEINKVVLVGGSARIPVIRNYVIEVFNTTPYADKPLDKLVAMGATIAVTDENTVQIRDILSHTLGTELTGDRFAPIIPKNTKYPVSMSDVYTTASDYQSSVSVGVYEGEDKDVNNNTYYGGFTLSDIEYAKQGVPKIKVTFSFDRNRILQVTAQDLNTNSSKSETIEMEHEAKKKVETHREAFDIALVMDVSGSMFGPPLQKAKEAARSLATEMIDLSLHRIGIVAFGSYAEKLVGLSNDEHELLYAIDSLHCIGSTNMAGGIEKANNSVLSGAGNRKLIILVTDGHPDSGPYAEREADNVKENGVKLVTIGIGNGIDRSLLKKLASSDTDYYEGGNFDDLTNIFQEITNSLQNK